MTESQVAELRQTGTNVLLDQVAGWCGTATTVTVRPVLDLNDHHHINGYVPTETIKEQVLLTWPQCVFPFCTRRSRRCDLDHRCPHSEGGATCPCNLAPLCRTHHRMKTFSGWTYQPADTTETGIPTAFSWTSPEGNRFRVDRGLHARTLTTPPHTPPTGGVIGMPENQTDRTTSAGMVRVVAGCRAGSPGSRHAARRGLAAARPPEAHPRKLAVEPDQWTPDDRDRRRAVDVAAAVGGLHADDVPTGATRITQGDVQRRMPGPSTAHRNVEPLSLEENRTTMRLVLSRGATEEIPVCGDVGRRRPGGCGRSGSRPGSRRRSRRGRRPAPGSPPR